MGYNVLWTLRMLIRWLDMRQKITATFELLFQLEKAHFRSTHPHPEFAFTKFSIKIPVHLAGYFSLPWTFCLLHTSCYLIYTCWLCKRIVLCSLPKLTGFPKIIDFIIRVWRLSGYSLAIHFFQNNVICCQGVILCSYLFLSFHHLIS